MKRIVRIASAAVCAMTATAVILPIRDTHGQTRTSSQVTTTIPPFAICSGNVNIASKLPGGANEDPDVVIGGVFITLTESELLQQVEESASMDLYHKVTLLGKTEIYDTNLSPAKNIACATCHAP